MFCQPHLQSEQLRLFRGLTWSLSMPDTSFLSKDRRRSPHAFENCFEKTAPE